MEKLKEMVKSIMTRFSIMCSTIGKGVIVGLGIVLLIGLAFGLSYLVMYCVVYGIFWAFGPVIFGYTFSYKIVIGIWLMLVLVNQFFKKSK